MSGSDFGGLLLILLLVVVIFLVGFSVGYKDGTVQEKERMSQAAIQAGCAERVIVDPLTGEVEFRFKAVR